MADHFKIILIDDEDARNLYKIYLKELDAKFFDYDNGQTFLNFLNNNTIDGDLIILNYLNNELNGVELTKRIKKFTFLRDIPIAMLTAKNDPQVFSDGIAAGVLYYLSKPVQKSAFKSVVEACLEKVEAKKNLYEESEQLKLGFNFLKQGYFEIQKINEVTKFSYFLSHFFPDPKRVISGIKDLLINAIEHGNLKSTYKAETKFFNQEEWKKDIWEKEKIPENESKVVKILFKRKVDSYVLTIEDEGDGFDWRKQISLDPSKAMETTGRGIAYANQISFDKLQFNEVGNKVTVTVFTSGSDDYWD